MAEAVLCPRRDCFFDSLGLGHHSNTHTTTPRAGPGRPSPVPRKVAYSVCKSLV